MKILVVVAHPDDEILGCGGTIARLARERHDVFIAILGEGITSRTGRRGASGQKQVKALHKQSKQVAKLLGAKDLLLHHLPDNRFDTLPLLDIVKIIENLIVKLSPEIIYTHHGGDLNIDHVITHRAVLTATRPIAGCPVKRLYAFEVPSSTEWTFGHLEPAFHPNVFVDISTTLEIKIKALMVYESEVREFPHPRSIEALRSIARWWGSVVGVGAAEAFELIRDIV
jgi:LmbE family N-acetylglucosaminyl deacetylase